MGRSSGIRVTILHEFRNKGYNLTAWDLVRKPKDKGGLGVINLIVQNDALLWKHLDKFYKKADVQWIKLIWIKYYNGIMPHLAKDGSFWWMDIMRLNTFYRGIVVCSPIKGDTISFWGDLINGDILSLVFPNLFEFAKDPNIYLWEMRQSDNLPENFRIPMMRSAYNEFIHMQKNASWAPFSSAGGHGHLVFHLGECILHL